MTDDFDLTQIIGPLLEWFADNARRLPWREDAKAYPVWVSEIMLQQTRVEAVKPYFRRFIGALPTVAALAKCPDDLLLKLWEGLGYYSRAKNLKAAAQQIMEEYGGIIPDDFQLLCRLPGIGHYTAGAIASIAYDKPEPAVDGNVLRVLSRLRADDADILLPATKSRAEEDIRYLLRTESEKETLSPGRFNQALMELGAIICLPHAHPRCTDCPCQSFCRARQRDQTEEFPVRRARKERRVEERTVLIVHSGGRAALHRREDGGLLAGLYELPNFLGYLSEKDVQEMLRQMGYLVRAISPLPDAVHTFTHIRWEMKGYAVWIRDGGSGQAPWIFVDPQEVRTRYALPSAFAHYKRYLLLSEESKEDMRIGGAEASGLKGEE